MMLAFARQLPFLVRAQIAGEWRDQATRERTFELGGQTLVLIGLGRIAQAVAVRASAFGMRIIGVRRRPDLRKPEQVDEVFPVARLAEALVRADHVVVTLPLTTRTRHFIGAKQLASMKPTAYIYNIGRGPVIDQEALAAALQAGDLAGAGLDVTDPEPLSADSPLWRMDNVLITAHTSGATPHYWDRAIEILESNLDRFVSGKSLINQVDSVEGY
jgi:phosphoglycerate dehydrogenase-like enzyme